MPVAPLKIFPVERVWIPSPDGSGKFYQRSVQQADKERRALVIELLTRQILPRGKQLTREQEKDLWEEKKQIRAALNEIPKPWELED